MELDDEDGPSFIEMAIGVAIVCALTAFIIFLFGAWPKLY
jgi:hypothetical protein